MAMMAMTTSNPIRVNPVLVSSGACLSRHSSSGKQQVPQNKRKKEFVELNFIYTTYNLVNRMSWCGGRLHLFFWAEKYFLLTLNWPSDTAHKP